MTPQTWGFGVVIYYYQEHGNGEKEGLTFSEQTIDYSEFKRGWNKAADVDLDDGNQVSTSTN